MKTLKELIHKCWKFYGQEYKLYKNGILYTMLYEHDGFAYCHMQGKTYAKTIMVNLDNLFNDDEEYDIKRIEKAILKTIQIWYSFIKYNDMTKMNYDYMWRDVEILK